MEKLTMNVLKEQAKKALNKAKETGKKALDWASENPIVASALVASIGSSVNGAFKYASKQIEESGEKRREARVYDPSNGFYVYLRKPLNNRQKIELNELRGAGMSVTDALRNMNLIK